MALSKAKVREILSKAGVDSEHMQEALTEILDGNIASIDAVKEERDKYKKDAEKLESVQKELNDLKESIDKDDENPFKLKYEKKVEDFKELKKEYDAFKADIEAKNVRQKKSEAFKQLLKDSNVSDKRINAIVKVSADTINAIEFDEEGKVKDSEKITDNIKTEWADFIVTEGKKGADTSTPPANTGDGDGKSRATGLAAAYHDRMYGKNKED